MYFNCIIIECRTNNQIEASESLKRTKNDIKLDFADLCFKILQGNLNQI